jgi:SpoIID/LytB domain protein
MKQHIITLICLFCITIRADITTVKSVIKEQITQKFKAPAPAYSKYKQAPIKLSDAVQHLIIRVLIEEKTAGQIAHAHWQFKSDYGFIIIDNERKTSRLEKNKQLTIGYSHGCLTLNGTKIKSHFIAIKPIKHVIGYKSHKYNGFFGIMLKQNQVYLVNYIDLEEYTESVLPCEGNPDWPDEFNKAFSIVVRTYGLAKVLEARELHKRQRLQVPYDIKNSNFHQIYKGYKPFEHLKKIVASTRNIVLAHNQKPILAMFDICCGGIIPAQLETINFVKAPYLARTYPCHYCQECKSYTWQANYSLDELRTLFGSETKKIARYRDAKVTKADPAGSVTEVKIKGKLSWAPLSGKKVKTTLKKLKSKCYTIHKRGRELVFSGKGYGHHLGLCQWGAYGMVKAGWDYQNILLFYYPEAHFMKLKVKHHASI